MKLRQKIAKTGVEGGVELDNLSILAKEKVDVDCRRFFREFHVRGISTRSPMKCSWFSFASSWIQTTLMKLRRKIAKTQLGTRQSAYRNERKMREMRRAASRVSFVLWCTFCYGYNNVHVLTDVKNTQPKKNTNCFLKHDKIKQNQTETK